MKKIYLNKGVPMTSQQDQMFSHSVSNPPEGDNLEKKFITWALARDDDWWEEGQGHISIWDVRVMLDFFKQELQSQRKELVEEIKERFIKRFAGYGEVWFPYESEGNCTKEEERQAAINEWEAMMENE